MQLAKNLYGKMQKILIFLRGGEVMEGEILKFSKKQFCRGGCRSRIPNLNPFGLLEVDKKSGEPESRNNKKYKIALLE